MTDLDELERRIKRGRDNPIPADLRGHIADYIEPNTMDVLIDHGDVMECIDTAWPEILDYLRAHPESLGGGS